MLPRAKRNILGAAAFRSCSSKRFWPKGCSSTFDWERSTKKGKVFRNRSPYTTNPAKTGLRSCRRRARGTAGSTCRARDPQANRPKLAPRGKTETTSPRAASCLSPAGFGEPAASGRFACGL